MSGGNGARGNWNPLQEDLLTRQDWDNRRRLMMLAVLACCPVSYGIYIYDIFQYHGIISKLQWYANPMGMPLESDAPFKPIQIHEVHEALQGLASGGNIKIYNDHVIWIRDRWGMTAVRSNPNHRKGAREYIQTHFPVAWDDFSKWYGLCDGDGMGDGMAITDTDKDTDKDTDTEDISIQLPDRFIAEGAVLLVGIEGWGKSIEETEEKLQSFTREPFGYSPAFILQECTKLRDWMDGKGEKSKNDFGRLNNWMSNARDSWVKFQRATPELPASVVSMQTKWDEA